MLPNPNKQQYFVQQFKFTLILTNNSNCKICIPNNITIGISDRINSTDYHINEITFNTNNKLQKDTTSDIPFQNILKPSPITKYLSVTPIQAYILKITMLIKLNSTAIRHSILPIQAQICNIIIQLKLSHLTRLKRPLLE